jgi:hypothetical protein
VFTDPDSPAEVELPATVLALLTGIEAVTAANPKLRKGALAEHGLKPSDFIRDEWQDPKVTFTAAKAGV